MLCKKCNSQFENRSLLMKHIKAGHDPVSETQPEEKPSFDGEQLIPTEPLAQPTPPADAPTAQDVQSTQETMAKVNELKSHFDALMDAFQEIRDADSRAGLMTVLNDMSINQQSSEQVFQRVFKVVSDGDARMVIRTHLRLL